MSTPFVDNSRVFNLFCAAIFVSTDALDRRSTPESLNMISSRFNVVGANIPDYNEVTIQPFEDQQAFESLGITATPVNPNTVENPDGSTPEEYNKATSLGNMVALWVVITVEMINSLLSPGSTTLRGLPGWQHMPYFDKLVLSVSPMKAILQHLYHVAEQHVKTGYNTVYLLSIKPDANNMIFRIGNRSWTTFVRAGLTIQIQLEEQASWLFTATELLTQQLWANNREQGFLDIFNMLSWSNNFIWSYNTPVNLATVGDEIPQHLIYMLQKAIQYGGTQQLEFLPEAARTKIRMVLNKWHPLL